MPSALRTCQFCGNPGRHPAAHIWPKALYNGDSGIPFRSFNTSGLERPRRSQIGLYDSQLWCERCERSSAGLDTVAAEYLLNIDKRIEPCRDERGQSLALPNGQPLAYTLLGADAKRLQLFLVSVLWRASASSLRELSGFCLGPYQDKFRELLKYQDDDALREFPYLIRMEQDVNMRGGFVTPARTKYDGVNFVQFHDGGFAFYVKVSNQPVPASFRQIANGPDGPVLIMPFRLLNTNEGRSLAAGARRSEGRSSRRSS